jgi:hypothetical protein
MMDEKFVRKLLSNMKCGICGCQYDSGNIKILGHREDLWFLSVFCPSCKSQGLVAAVVKAEGRCEILTELTEEERRKLSIPVNSDDVIDIHAFLKDFSGDFSSLFTEK